MSEPKTLLLRETGIVRLDDGSEAVNVGPIVHALGFLTEGRGDDRGTDEHGTPLPDLLSLAFDVVQSIILGGRAAEFFRKVKQEFDTQSALEGRGSLALAKRAATVVRRSTPSSALEKAAAELRARLQELDGLALDEAELAELKQALQSFRDFGADRWVAATSHLLQALNALDHTPRARATAPAKPRRQTARRATAPAPVKSKTRARSKAPTKPRADKRPAAAKKKARKRAKRA
ncbi:MAG TPA: hypothetical protein VHP33_20825 [Polyangiaceae bacterium]|nr:hypothetical protein [Polyangiaceae bacterium]